MAVLLRGEKMDRPFYFAYPFTVNRVSVCPVTFYTSSCIQSPWVYRQKKKNQTRLFLLLQQIERDYKVVFFKTKFLCPLPNSGKSIGIQTSLQSTWKHHFPNRQTAQTGRIAYVWRGPWTVFVYIYSQVEETNSTRPSSQLCCTWHACKMCTARLQFCDRSVL